MTCTMHTCVCCKVSITNIPKIMNTNQAKTTNRAAKLLIPEILPTLFEYNLKFLSQYSRNYWHTYDK